MRVPGPLRSLRLSRLSGLVLAGGLTACATPPMAPVVVVAAPMVAAPAELAWTQFTADQGWVVRALPALGAECPALRWPGGSAAMTQRSAPGSIASRVAGGPPAQFSAASCEAPWPVGVTTLQVGRLAKPLLAPVLEPQHIVLVADTGCRMKQADQAFQACNDPVAWPFARVAAAAAALKPDLIVHIGDIHYRESPCPADQPGCAGSVWGYGEEAWRADFFTPAAPLLNAAPWVFVRGNHEVCKRAGVGWARYLDAAKPAPDRRCEDPALDGVANFTAPYAVPLSADWQLIVFDSSAAVDLPYRSDDPAFQRYAAQLRQVQALARQRPHNIFLNHHPVLGFEASADGHPKPGHAGLRSVMAAVEPQRLFAPAVDVVLNGHVHLFEALDFSSDHPATAVLGNSGSAMSGYLDAAEAVVAEPAPGARVAQFDTHRNYGFATLDRTASGWTLTARDTAGTALTVCAIKGAAMRCRGASHAQ